MKDFFSRSLITVILIAVLLSLIMGICSALSGGRISPLTDLVNIICMPIQKATTSISDGVYDFFKKISDFNSMAEKNEELTKKLAIAEKTIRDGKKALLENEQLRAALDMKQRDMSLTFESAEIVARGDENMTSSFTLDKGSLSGISVNNCVITVDGMVGYISAVGTNWSVVTTVIDTAMEASAIVSRTRDVASAEGDFDMMHNGKLKLSYLNKDAMLVRGDTVETSGFGGLFPKGIVIGRVEEIKSEAHGITKYAVLSPAVDLSQIDHVLVIKSFEVTE